MEYSTWLQTFSECSRRSIGEVLLSKSSCFQAPQTVCGDYQVNGNEACDVGPDGDSCCTSLCTLTDGSQCRYNNYSLHGVLLALVVMQSFLSLVTGTLCAVETV